MDKCYSNLPFSLLINLIGFTIVILTIPSCQNKDNGSKFNENTTPDFVTYNDEVVITEDVSLSQYFYFIDSLLLLVNENSPVEINEYVLVHANPWIIDSLAATDYYILKDKGLIVRDLLALTIFHKGQVLRIPKQAEINLIKTKLKDINLDLNIPEYRLRVFESDHILHEFIVRVGRDERKFLAMADHVVDLKTKTGDGEIVRIVKNASFINPVNNKAYHLTHRDDSIITSLPSIPWLEPELNGIKHGQLIHPTTNLKTLGKSYSNGCVGLRESDSWILYYHAPLGTRVNFRYDLSLPDQPKLKDIYNKGNK